MEIGVTDTAEEDLDLHVMFIAPRDRRGGKRRRRAASGVSLRFYIDLRFLLFRPFVSACIVRR